MPLKRRFKSFQLFPVALAMGVVLLALGAVVPEARANLLLSPTRVIMDNRNKTGVVTVMNQDTSPIRYRVSLALYRYRPNGALEEIMAPTPDESRLKELIRFSPRQAVLPPRGHQKIRLQFRKYQGFAQGEYRMHLKVSPVPDPPDEPGVGAKGQGVKIKIMVGVAIPIVIRNGKLWVKATPISCRPIISRHSGQPALEIEVKREGTRSVIADIFAYHLQKDNPGNETFIGQSRGAVIYTQFDSGTFEIPVEESLLSRLKSGAIRIDVRDSEMKPGKMKNLMGSKEFKPVQFP